VTARDEWRELRWRGHFHRPWLAAGDHTFTLEPSGQGVRFTQREEFTGALPWLARALLVHETQRSFDAMNCALKGRAEGARSARRRGDGAGVRMASHP
jgi:hypothetical protein